MFILGLQIILTFSVVFGTEHALNYVYHLYHEVITINHVSDLEQVICLQIPGQ